MKTKPLLFLGAGNMAETFVEWFDQRGEYQLAGFVEDGRAGETLSGRPILSVEQAIELHRTHWVISMIGSPDKAPLIARFEEAGFRFATYCSPDVDLNPGATLEPGVLVSAKSVIDTHTRIGRHTMVLVDAMISHHTTIGPYSFITSRVMIGGNCTIGERVTLGMGAIIRDGITIGDGATVGAGAVVVKDVSPGATVVGNTAKPLDRSKSPATETPKKPLLFLGAGDMAQIFAPLAHEFGEYRTVGFVEDQPKQKSILGIPVLSVEEALKHAETHWAICPVGTPLKRKLVAPFESAGFRFARLYSPTAGVSPGADVGEGVLVSANSVIDPFAAIGKHTVVSLDVLVSHHSRIGEFSFVGPGAMIAGNCTIGSRCFIGMGALIRDGLTLGDDVTVGTGAVVVKDVPSGTTVVGNPAKPVPSRSQRQPVLILGAGEQAESHAENVLDHPDYEVVGFVQDTDPEPTLSHMRKLPVHFIDDIRDLASTHKVVCCIGSMEKRRLIAKIEKLGFEFVTLIASSAMVSPKARLGQGCFVSHTGQIASFAHVGDHTMIGRLTMVGHHSKVGAYSLIAGGAIIGGGAQIGESCFIGMGALIRDHVKLGDNVTVGAGAVVIEDIPSGATVVGNPARPVEKQDESPGTPHVLKPLLLLGAGGWAENSAQAIEDDGRYVVGGFVEEESAGDGAGIEPRTLLGKPVLTVKQGLERVETHAALGMIGSPSRRGLIEKFESAGFEFAVWIAPTAILTSGCSLAPGCYVSKLASVATATTIDRHAAIMSRVNVGHHVHIGAFTTLASGCLIGGHSVIGSGCYIGNGAVIRDRITIGDGATVGSGAVVVKDVAPGTTVVGNPARPLVKKTDGSNPR